MKIIDLSVIINEATPVYPGDPKTKIEPSGIFDKVGYMDHFVSIGTHVGTHVDAPAHMVKNGKTLDQIPVEKFFGNGVYTKVKNGFNFEEIKKVKISSGDIVLFHTGMSDKYYEPAYYEKYPAMTEEIANYLVKKKVKMVGVDMCSVDYPEYPAHRILLGSDILIIENLTNLSALANKKFTIYALPIKLQLDGASARVIAQIK